MQECALPSPKICQPQPRQGYLRLPDLLLHSRRLGLGVIDNQPEFIFAWREIGKENKLVQGVDRFIRRPLACHCMVCWVPEQITLLVDKRFFRIV